MYLFFFHLTDGLSKLTTSQYMHKGSKSTKYTQQGIRARKQFFCTWQNPNNRSTNINHEKQSK